MVCGHKHDADAGNESNKLQCAEVIEKLQNVFGITLACISVELPSRGQPNADPETRGISMFITVLAIVCLKNNEKNSDIEKIAETARKLGWPDQIVDTTRMQMEAIAKMQVQTMDRMMDTWEEQIKSLNPSSTMLSKLTSLPNFGPVGSWPNTGNPQMAALSALQFYIQIAQQWQKAWADAMASWAKANTSSRA
jgi:hypothetical protein